MVKLLPVEHSCTIDKILDYIPDLMQKANKIVDKMANNKQENNEVKIQTKPRIKKVDIDYQYDYNNKINKEEEDE